MGKSYVVVSEDEALNATTIADAIGRQGWPRPSVFLEPEHERREFPYEDGDVIVLGPEVFVDKAGERISWKGELFIQHDVSQPHAFADREARREPVWQDDDVAAFTRAFAERDLSRTVRELHVLRALDGPGPATFDELMIRVRPMAEPALLAVVFTLTSRGHVRLDSDSGKAFLTDKGRDLLSGLDAIGRGIIDPADARERDAEHVTHTKTDVEADVGFLDWPAFTQIADAAAYAQRTGYPVYIRGAHPVDPARDAVSAHIAHNENDLATIARNLLTGSPTGMVAIRAVDTSRRLSDDPTGEPDDADTVRGLKATAVTYDEIEPFPRTQIAVVEVYAGVVDDEVEGTNDTRRLLDRHEIAVPLPTAPGFVTGELAVAALASTLRDNEDVIEFAVSFRPTPQPDREDPEQTLQRTVDNTEPEPWYIRFYGAHPHVDSDNATKSYEWIRDAISMAFNPPDDDGAEEHLLTIALGAAVEYIEAQPCTCTTAMVADLDPCPRCSVLGQLGNEPRQR